MPRFSPFTMKALLLLFLLPVLACGQDNSAFTLGNPATIAKRDTGRVVLVKPTYTVVFERANSRPLLVAWHLDKTDFGPVPRFGDLFLSDPKLPTGYYPVGHFDYTKTGYDRGHLCPSGDRTTTVVRQTSTFIMTNVIPQAPLLNRETWEQLESWTRDQVKAGREAYVVAGGWARQGTLGKSPIQIPAFCWKVIVLLPDGLTDLDRMGQAIVLAVWMPNSDAVALQKWSAYRVSVCEIEEKTGLKFFPTLPESIRHVLVNQ